MFKEYVKNLRRYFHMYPEISMKEYETTKKISKELKRMDVEHEIVQDGRGVIAKLSGNNKCGVAIRCEIDALPIQENSNSIYRSKNVGTMHACGHDANIAMCLGTIALLRGQQLHQDIYVVFQTDEEIARGAINFMSMQWYKNIDYIVALHTNNKINGGEFFVKSGNIICGVENFVIKNTADIDISMIDKYNNGEFFDDDFIKLKISKKSTREIIKGSICYFDEKKLDEVKEKIKSKIHSIKYTRLTLPVKNDDILYRNSVEIINGMKVNNKNIDYIHGGEDFSYYIQNKRGLYVFVGTGNEEKNIIHNFHTPSFDIDDDFLYLGSQFLARLMLRKFL